MRHLGHEVAVDGAFAEDAQHVLRVERTLGQRLSGFDLVVLGDVQARRGGQFVLAGVAGLVGDRQQTRTALAADPPADASANLSRFRIFVLVGRLGQAREQMSGIDLLVVLDQHTSLERQLILVAVDFLGGQSQTAQLSIGEHVHAPVNLGNQCLTLGRASLKQLDYAGQTGGDVGDAGDAAGVERPHGELSARLADALCCDDANRSAHFNQLTSRQRLTVAVLTQTALFAADHR